MEVISDLMMVKPMLDNEGDVSNQRAVFGKGHIEMSKFGAILEVSITVFEKNENFFICWAFENPANPSDEPLFFFGLFF